MAERKSFQSQTLNSEDYKEIEIGAKALKTGIILSAAALFIGVSKKCGPALQKNLSKLRKI